MMEEPPPITVDTFVHSVHAAALEQVEVGAGVAIAFLRTTFL